MVLSSVLRWHRRNANRSCYARFLLPRNSKNHQKWFCYAPLRTIFCRICMLRTRFFSDTRRGPAIALCHLNVNAKTLDATKARHSNFYRTFLIQSNLRFANGYFFNGFVSRIVNFEISRIVNFWISKFYNSKNLQFEFQKFTESIWLAVPLLWLRSDNTAPT